MATTSWSISSVRHAFGEALARYQALEHSAARFPDDVIRGFFQGFRIEEDERVPVALVGDFVVAVGRGATVDGCSRTGQAQLRGGRGHEL